MPWQCHDAVTDTSTAESDWVPHRSSDAVLQSSSEYQVERWKCTLVHMHSHDDGITQRRMQCPAVKCFGHSPRLECNTLYCTKFHHSDPHKNIERLHCYIYNVLHNCLGGFELLS
jgi:hypothetical protein